VILPSRGFFYYPSRDAAKRTERQSQTETSRQQTDYELLKKEDRQTVQKKYESSKAEIKDLINIFKEKGYHHGAGYLENLTQRLFTHVEIWLRTGVIAPKTTSLLERIFREIGRRIKRIAWGWSDSAVSKLSKMIILKKYSKEKWQQYWKQKLGIEGNFSIRISQVEICPCPHF